MTTGGGMHQCPPLATPLVKVLAIAPLRESYIPQKRSGKARVLKGSHGFTCTSTRSSTIGMSQPPMPFQYSFTDPEGMDG